jgi:uncharacterized membrane protein
VGDYVTTLAHYTVDGLEILGISIIALVATAATIHLAVKMIQREPLKALYHDYRHALIRGVLVALELLVAADIIRSVAVEFTLHSIATLGLLVVIRTFLSFTLEVELSGNWPWQQS